MISSPSRPSQYGPVNQSRGTVEYLNAGASGIIASRRNSAYRQMFEACGGKYKIINEYPNKDNWYIDFECVKEPENSSH